MANNIPEMAYNRKMMAKKMMRGGGMAKAAKRKMMMGEKDKSSMY